MPQQFVPIFEKEGNRFFVLTKDFVGQDEQEAREIGWGAMLVECILLGAKNTGDVVEIPSEGIPHARAELDNVPVAILSGPLFDKAVAVDEAKGA